MPGYVLMGRDMGCNMTLRDLDFDLENYLDLLLCFSVVFRLISGCVEVYRCVYMCILAGWVWIRV